MVNKLSGKPDRQEVPKDEATRKFYELAALYTMTFHRGEAKPDWFWDRVAELEGELGEEKARAALDYAHEHESFYHKLM